MDHRDDDSVSIDRTPTMWLGTVQGGKVYLRQRATPVANVQEHTRPAHPTRESAHEPALVIRETRGKLRVIYVTARECLDRSGRTLFQQLANAVEEAACHPDVAALLIVSEQDALAAPYTLGTMQTDLNARFAFRHMLETLVACDKPVVVAAHGDVRGWGTSLLLRADVAFCSQGARFRPPLVTLSSAQPDGGVLLTQRMGYQRAAEWLLSGRWLDATESTAAALVADVRPGASLVTHALRRADQIARQDERRVRESKQRLRDALLAEIEHGNSESASS